MTAVQKVEDLVRMAVVPVRRERRLVEPVVAPERVGGDLVDGDVDPRRRDDRLERRHLVDDSRIHVGRRDRDVDPARVTGRSEQLLRAHYVGPRHAAARRVVRVAGQLRDVAGEDALALDGGLHDGSPVHRHLDRLDDAAVGVGRLHRVEGVVEEHCTREREELELRVLLDRLHLRERDAVAEVGAAVRDRLHLGVRVRDVDGLDSIQIRQARHPVMRVPHHLPAECRLPGLEHERSGADRGLLRVGAVRVDPGLVCAGEARELRIRLLQVEHDGVRVRGLDPVGVELGAEPRIRGRPVGLVEDVPEAPGDVLRGQRLAVVELDARPQLEGPRLGIGCRMPGNRQAGPESPRPGHDVGEAVVRVVERRLRDRDAGLHRGVARLGRRRVGVDEVQGAASLCLPARKGARNEQAHAGARGRQPRGSPQELLTAQRARRVGCCHLLSSSYGSRSRGSRRRGGRTKREPLRASLAVAVWCGRWTKSTLDPRSRAVNATTQTSVAGVSVLRRRRSRT